MKRQTWTVLTFAVLATSACNTDNREHIAMATLYADGAPASQVRTPSRPFPEMSGALNEKFPAGTDVGSLKRYVAGLDGKCSEDKPGETHCSFIESAALCVRTSITLQVKTDSGNRIGHIEAHRLLEGC